MKINDADPTLCNKYANNEVEFVFCVKGRPFSCLVSPHLPIPTASLVDYALVRDTGLKMTDLQCTKVSFGGYKMRILGKVSLTVQCIHDGVSSRTFHVKGNVVLDLAKNFDCDAISGSKMRSLLLNGRSSPSSLSSPSRSTSPSSTSTPPARPSAQSSTARPSAQSSTARPSAQSSTARTSAPPSSQGRTSPNPSPSSPRTPKNSNSAASGSELFHEASTRSEKSNITAVRSRKYDG